MFTSFIKWHEKLWYFFEAKKTSKKIEWNIKEEIEDNFVALSSAWA